MENQNNQNKSGGNNNRGENQYTKDNDSTNRSDSQKGSQGGSQETSQGKSQKGFASMDEEKQRKIASEGGKASHERDTEDQSQDNE